MSYFSKLLAKWLGLIDSSKAISMQNYKSFHCFMHRLFEHLLLGCMLMKKVCCLTSQWQIPGYIYQHPEWRVKLNWIRGSLIGLQLKSYQNISLWVKASNCDDLKCMYNLLGSITGLLYIWPSVTYYYIKKINSIITESFILLL